MAYQHFMGYLMPELIHLYINLANHFAKRKIHHKINF